MPTMTTTTLEQARMARSTQRMAQITPKAKRHRAADVSRAARGARLHRGDEVVVRRLGQRLDGLGAAEAELLDADDVRGVDLAPCVAVAVLAKRAPRCA